MMKNVPVFFPLAITIVGLCLSIQSTYDPHRFGASYDRSIQQAPQVELVDEESVTFRLMSFNIWIGGEAGGQPIEQTAEVIRAAKADVVGIQESFGSSRPITDNAKKVAEILGWHHVNQQGGSTSIISRFPIVQKTGKGWGVEIELAEDESIYVFNAHLPPSPYQPYQLAGIEYPGGGPIETEEEAISEARRARGKQVAEMLTEINQVADRGLMMFLTGDLNEPSYQDWTAAAAAAGLCQIKVEYPTTKAITDLDFQDAFRIFHPDETKRRGNTWTPIKTDDDPTERHDRIDYVFFRGDRVELIKVEVVGESETRGSDIVVNPYPSDHRAVVAEFRISPAK